MLSVDLARALRDAGLQWTPARGDSFVMPDRDMDSDVFVVSDLTIEVHQFPAGPVIGFNGTTEWALNSVEQSQVQGDPVALAQAHDDLVRMARATGQTFFHYMAGCMTYARQPASGDFPAAHRTCDALLALGTSFGSDDTEGPCAVQSYMVRRETGAVDQVRALITGDERPEDHWAPGLLALCTGLQLDGPTARLLAWLHDGRLGGHEDSAQWPCVLAYAVEATRFLGDEGAARTLRR